MHSDGLAARHAHLFELSAPMKVALQLYGFGAFTAATAAAGFAVFFAPVVMKVAAVTAFLGGAAGLAGWVAAEKRTHEPTLVFVSYGGTCRDPMAKVIMDRLVAGRDPPIRILATALKDPSGRRASRAARYVVREATGSNLLEDHRPQMLDDEIVRNADLILTMTEEHAREIRKAFKELSPQVDSLLHLAGGSGDIVDPWQGRDDMDDATIDRYQACYTTLSKVLSENADKIYSRVTA